MSLTRRVVNRPTTFFVLFALVLGFGLYTSLDIPIDLFPEIEPPVLVLTSTYEGAGPEEVERNLTRPLESFLSNVSNIDRISSTSSEGRSQLILEFVWGTDMVEAANDVRDRLEFVRNNLPDEASSPQIFKFDPSQIPILQLEVSGNRSPEELREIAVNTIQPRIEQIEGVALASVQGGRERIIRVEIPQNRLEAYNLTFNQIAQALRTQNAQVSAGSITEGDNNLLIRTAGEFRSIEDIRNAVVATRGGGSAMGFAGATAGADASGANIVVRLGDIAEVYEGLRRETNAVYINGRPGVFVIVQKQSGTNSVQTADNVYERLPAINEALPLDMQISALQDTTEIIRDSLETVSRQAVGGAGLAVLILFVFLRSIKTTLVIAISIPASIIITLMFMFFFGLTLNIMTLAGLALGVGLLVDNSIVILENIYRYREKGAKLTASAVLGSQEMITPIVASTLTTICVFLPIAIFRDRLEFIGELFSGLAFTVVISLASSLLVAIFLVPVLASRYVPLDTRKQRPLAGLLKSIDDVMQRFFDGLNTLYKRALGAVLGKKILTVLVTAAVFGGSLLLIPLTGFELIPSQPEDSVGITVQMPVGTTLDATREVLLDIEAFLESNIQRYDNIVVNAGGGGGFLSGTQSHRGTVEVSLPAFEERIETDEDIRELMRTRFDRYPAAEITFGAGGGGPGGGGFGPPIDIKIRGEDLTRSREVGERIQELLLEHLPEVTEPTLNTEDGLPQVDIVVDRERAYALGLNVAGIGSEIRANIDGVTASQFRTSGNEYDILLLLDEADRSAVPDINRMFVMSDQGRRIPVSSFATLERTTGPVSIERENQARTINLTAGLAPGADLNVVEPQIRALIQQEIPTEDDLIIEFGGDYEELLRYGRTFVIIMIVSVLLVFGVMASQFESFLDPLIIFFSIPLTLIGVIGLYVFTGENFSLFTAVGLVMLVGIVVNNGIVLVDYTNLLRKRGLGLYEACIEAGGDRLRPILMTTLTTVLGLLPVAFLEGEGSSLIQPIAKTVVGGLSVSALMTLFLIPVLYAVFNKLSIRFIARREKMRDRRLQKVKVKEMKRMRIQENQGDTHGPS
ncbi:MAG: efflux RND transporter permease subunit [Spirochaetia bacterium]